MLLVICSCNQSRYAFDARQVVEVLPRAQLQALSGSSPWFGGLLIYRGEAVPVVDLTSLLAGIACPDRYSSRLVVVETDWGGTLRRLGFLAERVGLLEWREAPDGHAGQTTSVGSLLLDGEEVLQLIDVGRLVSEDRQQILFGTRAGRL